MQKSPIQQNFCSSKLKYEADVFLRQAPLKLSKQKADQVSNRLYSAAKRKQVNLEKLKREREISLMSEVQQKPTICKKSDALSQKVF